MPPAIVLNQSDSIEAGAGELVEISANVIDNSQVEMVEFLSEVVTIPLSLSGGDYRATVGVPTDVIDQLKLAGITQGSLPYSRSAPDVAGYVTVLPAGGIRILDKTPPEAIIDPNLLIVAQGDILN